MIEPELGEKVIIDGVTYECAEPTGLMWDECDFWFVVMVAKSCVIAAIGKTKTHNTKKSKQ